MYTSNRYINVIWSRKFPYIKTLELTSGSWSCLSSDMVLIFFYIKRRNKGGAFICKSNQRCGAYSVAAFIRLAVLNRSFTVTALVLGKKGKNERFILSLGKLTLISQVPSCQTGHVVLFVMGKNGNFCSNFSWLGAFIVIYASVVFMGAVLKSL